MSRVKPRPQTHALICIWSAKITSSDGVFGYFYAMIPGAGWQGIRGSIKPIKSLWLQACY